MSQTFKKDAAEVLIEDHRRAERLFSDIKRSTDPKERTEKANLLIKELSQHGYVEEQVVYPTLKHFETPGIVLADTSFKDHQKLKEELYAFDQSKSTDPNFDRLLGVLEKDFNDHIKKEEAEIFPLMRQRLPKQEIDQMGSLIENMKIVAPTRPHPGAPAEGVSSTVVGPLNAFMDRIRDLSKSWPKESK